MKTLVIGFSRPIAWKIFAEAIMWVDKTNYDHGFVQFCSDRWGVDFIYQSSGLRTNFMGDNYFDKINVTVERYAIEVPDDVEAKVGKLCVDREGTPYGIKEVVGKAIVTAVFLAFGQRIKNPFTTVDPDCITEVANILSQGLGIQIPLEMDSVTVKPFRDFVASLPMAKMLQDLPQSEAV